MVWQKSIYVWISKIKNYHYKHSPFNPLTPTRTLVPHSNFILTLKTKYSKHNFAYPKLRESVVSYNFDKIQAIYTNFYTFRE